MPTPSRQSQAAATEATRDPLPDKTCPCGCGETFTPVRYWQMYKDPVHQQRYWKAVRDNVRAVMASNSSKP